MSTTYFLTFLLGLVVLTAAATAEQNGNGALDEPRFHSRNWGEIKNHPSKSIEESLERAHDDVAMRRAKHTGARLTMEKTTEDRTAAGCLSGAKNKNLENNGRAMPENRPEYYVAGFNKKSTMEKLEEGTKYKPAGYRAKPTDIHKYGNMHQ